MILQREFILTLQRLTQTMRSNMNNNIFVSDPGLMPADDVVDGHAARHDGPPGCTFHRDTIFRVFFDVSRCKNGDG